MMSRKFEPVEKRLRVAIGRLWFVRLLISFSHNRAKRLLIARWVMVVIRKSC